MRKQDVEIEYHADDYALFPVQSGRILDCRRNGNLNGVSIMPNSPWLGQCMSDLIPFSADMALTVHLNLLEGKSLCQPEEIPLLTDEDGVLNGSFFRLLLHSFLPGRKAYQDQLKKELRAQIHAVLDHMEPGMPLRLDGHAHYHMIPVVFDAMMDVIREENLYVSYIRIPREYPLLYLRHLCELQDLACINLVKVLILNLLAWRAEHRYAAQLAAMDRKLFLGVFLSGRMYRQNVSRILPDAVKLASRMGRNMEILAHPGGVYEEEDIAKITAQEDREFLTSYRREGERSLFLMETDRMCSIPKTKTENIEVPY